LKINAYRGFLGVFGSLDCMHSRWKNCLVEWQGYQNKNGKMSNILEIIAN
jgi:hypothetical protein